MLGLGVTGRYPPLCLHKGVENSDDEHGKSPTKLHTFFNPYSPEGKDAAYLMPESSTGGRGYSRQSILNF